MDNFFNQNISKILSSSQDNIKTLELLLNTYSKYHNVLKDYLNIKEEYIKLIKKYADDKPKMPHVDTFPGIISQGQPSYSQEEMNQDTEKINKIAELLKELIFQKDNFEIQLQKILAKSNQDIQIITNFVEQLDNYLNKITLEIGDIYGSSSVNELLSKSFN